MKLVCISGRKWNGPIRRDAIANTNDIGIAWCLGAREHMEMQPDLDRLASADALFVTMWKVREPGEERWMQAAYDFKRRWPGKKIIVYQEAELRWPQYRSWQEQQELYELLQIADLFLAHNEADAAFFQLLMGRDGKAQYFPAVQDLKLLEPYRNAKKTPKSVLVQHFDNRSNGLFAALIAKRAGASEILHMNTSTYHDDRNARADKLFCLGLTEIPSCGWTEWAQKISRAHVYLHPITVCGAGRDTIACAYLGVPVIGNKHLTAQTALFPDLAIDIDSVAEMESKLNGVFRNEDLYTIFRESAMARAEALFSVEAGERAAAGVLEWLWKA